MANPTTADGSKPRPGRKRPSVFGFLRRSILVVAGLLLAWITAVNAIANSGRAINPLFVERVSNDPLAPLLRLQLEIALRPPLINDERVRDEALQSLRTLPLNTHALRLLALYHATHRNPQSAHQFSALSERISRRDFLTQVLLVQESVESSDIPQALVHYDRALRTSRAGRNALFPVLSAALVHDDIIRALTGYLDRRANWGPAFIASAVQNERADPRRVAMLLLATSPENQAWLLEESAPPLFRRLARADGIALARRLYARMPNSNLQQLTMAGFNSVTTDRRIDVLGWLPGENGRVAANFEGQTGTEQRVARVFVTAGERGVALRRVLMLSPGQYRLREHRVGISGSSSARATWQMRCLSDGEGTYFWRGPSDQLAYRVSNLMGPTVSGGCRYQVIELEVFAGNDGQDLELLINDFQLDRN